MPGGIESSAKTLILLGAFLVLLGGFLLLAAKVPFIGRLPGDVHIRRGNFSFYFPVTTSILISILLTLIVSFVKRR